MERWLRSVAVAAAPVDPQKESEWQSAVKAEMSRVWDSKKNRDAMLGYIEFWLAKEAPEGIRSHKLREDLYPLMVEVYEQKNPEDFEEKPKEDPLFKGIKVE